MLRKLGQAWTPLAIADWFRNSLGLLLLLMALAPADVPLVTL